MQKIEYDLPIFEDNDKADLNDYSVKMANAIKNQIDKFGNPLIFKGAVQTLADLQTLTNIKSGYIYRVDNENKNYIYNGTEWVVYSDNIDLSKYQEEVNTQINEVNTQLTNIEQEGIIVSPTEPIENRRKVWMQEAEGQQKIHILNDNNIYEKFMKKEENIYSTQEQIVGKWIDGKPLYRKVIKGSIGTTTTVTLISSGISKLIDAKGYVQTNTNHQMIVNSTYDDKSNDLRVFKHFNGYIALQVGSMFLNGEYEITVEYTKTTD